MRRAGDTGTPLVVSAPRTHRPGTAARVLALLAPVVGLPFVAVDLLIRAMLLAAGLLSGQAGTSDVADAAVVVCTRKHCAGRWSPATRWISASVDPSHCSAGHKSVTGR